MPEHDEDDAPDDEHQHHDGTWHSDCPECLDPPPKSKVERWRVEDKVVDGETK